MAVLLPLRMHSANQSSSDMVSNAPSLPNSSELKCQGERTPEHTWFENVNCHGALSSPELMSIPLGRVAISCVSSRLLR